MECWVVYKWGCAGFLECHVERKRGKGEQQEILDLCSSWLIGKKDRER
jgi:hypothetical protein